MPTLPSNVSEEEILSLVEGEMFGLDNDGICQACGNIQGGCEPDAQNYECEDCGKMEVFGAAEYLF